MSSSIIPPTIAALVVAGGLSTRMGALKQLLPYGQRTVIEQIVSVLGQCPLHEVVVVIGHEREAIQSKLSAWPVRPVFNANYQEGEMLSSIQCGLAGLGPEIDAAMLVLGDQPQLEAGVIQQLIKAYQTGAARLVIPSFQMRRGHPIVIDRTHWPEVLSLAPDKSLRDVISPYSGEICYVVVETDSVLRDMDTPAEYQRELRHLATKSMSNEQ